MAKVGARTASIMLLLAACGAPLQNGDVAVLPGSAERLMLALRMGLPIPGDGIPEVATARRIVSSELLLPGEAPRSKLGDYLIENRRVRVIVADIDGTARGGTLVDLAYRSSERDGFDGLATDVFGRRVRYTSIKDGYDEATSSAFVSVTGSPEGMPDVEVQTRYDVAPGLANVVVHTTIKPTADAPASTQVADVIVSNRARFVTHGEGVGVFGSASASFGVKPLLSDPPAPFVNEAHDGDARLAVDFGEARAPIFLYSRMIAPIERADTLALAAGMAQDEPGSVTDLDVGLAAEKKGAGPFVGVFRIDRIDGDRATLELVPAGPLKPGDRVAARIPAGRYRIRFVAGGDQPASTEAAFVVKRGQNARLDLRVPEARPNVAQPPAAEPLTAPTARGEGE